MPPRKRWLCDRCSWFQNPDVSVEQHLRDSHSTLLVFCDGQSFYALNPKHDQLWKCPRCHHGHDTKRDLIKHAQTERCWEEAQEEDAEAHDSESGRNTPTRRSTRQRAATVEVAEKRSKTPGRSTPTRRTTRMIAHREPTPEVTETQPAPSTKKGPSTRRSRKSKLAQGSGAAGDADTQPLASGSSIGRDDADTQPLASGSSIRRDDADIQPVVSGIDVHDVDTDTQPVASENDIHHDDTDIQPGASESGTRTSDTSASTVASPIATEGATHDADMVVASADAIHGGGDDDDDDDDDMYMDWPPTGNTTYREDTPDDEFDDEDEEEVEATLRLPPVNSEIAEPDDSITTQPAYPEIEEDFSLPPAPAWLGLPRSQRRLEVLPPSSLIFSLPESEPPAPAEESSPMEGVNLPEPPPFVPEGNDSPVVGADQSEPPPIVPEEKDSPMGEASQPALDQAPQPTPERSSPPHDDNNGPLSKRMVSAYRQRDRGHSSVSPPVGRDLRRVISQGTLRNRGNTSPLKAPSLRSGSPRAHPYAHAARNRSSSPSLKREGPDSASGSSSRSSRDSPYAPLFPSPLGPSRSPSRASSLRQSRAISSFATPPPESIASSSSQSSGRSSPYMPQVPSPLGLPQSTTPFSFARGEYDSVRAPPPSRPASALGTNTLEIPTRLEPCEAPESIASPPPMPASLSHVSPEPEELPVLDVSQQPQVSPEPEVLPQPEVPEVPHIISPPQVLAPLTPTPLPQPRVPPPRSYTTLEPLQIPPLRLPPPSRHPSLLLAEPAFTQVIPSLRLVTRPVYALVSLQPVAGPSTIPIASSSAYPVPVLSRQPMTIAQPYQTHSYSSYSSSPDQRPVEPLFPLGEPTWPRHRRLSDSPPSPPDRPWLYSQSPLPTPPPGTPELAENQFTWPFPPSPSVAEGPSGHVIENDDTSQWVGEDHIVKQKRKAKARSKRKDKGKGKAKATEEDEDDTDDPTDDDTDNSNDSSDSSDGDSGAPAPSSSSRGRGPRPPPPPPENPRKRKRRPEPGQRFYCAFAGCPDEFPNQKSANNHILSKQCQGLRALANASAFQVPSGPLKKYTKLSRPGPRFPCPVPGCPDDFAEQRSVDRHIRRKRCRRLRELAKESASQNAYTSKSPSPADDGSELSQN